MKLSECATNGINKVRKSIWQPNAYLQFDLINGKMGPWGKLYDQPTQNTIGVESPQTVLLIGDESDDWEEFPPNNSLNPNYS